MKMQQIKERTEARQNKDYQKDDILELESLVRGLVKLQAERDLLTKQLADEQLVKSITTSIVETPTSESGTPLSMGMGTGMQTPPYTASSPMMMPVQMPMGVPAMMMQVPVPMQQMQMQQQMHPMQAPAAPAATGGEPDTESSGSGGSTTRKIVLK